MIQIFIPTSRQKQSKNGEKQYTAYCIEFYLNGKCYKFEKRYSEFYELHRALKKYCYQLPCLPPKKMLRNSSQKLIEQRRKSLEEYLKFLLKNIGLDKAKELNEFLNLNTPSVTNLNKKNDNEQQQKFLFRSIVSKDEQQEKHNQNFNFHQCMIEFKNDYLYSTDFYLANTPDSFSSDSNSEKSNIETNSFTSSTTNLTQSKEYYDIVVIGSLNAIYR